MLYYLFEYLQNAYDFPGAGLFQYISFRAAMAIITSLLVSLVFGGKIINPKTNFVVLFSMEWKYVRPKYTNQ